MNLLAVSSKVLEKYEFTNGYCPINLDELSILMNSFATSVDHQQLEKSGFLKVISFVYVTCGDMILVSRRRKSNNLGELRTYSEPVLGFGRQCQAMREYGHSFVTMICENLYNELDIYIPGVPLQNNFSGLIFSDERDYDKNSLGCLFNAEIKIPVPDKILKDKLIGLREIDIIPSSSVFGWSKIIYDMFKSCLVS